MFVILVTAVSAITVLKTDSGNNSQDGNSNDFRHDIFRQPPGQPIQIDITDDNLARLRAHPREYVECGVRLGRTSFPNAIVHLKGRGSFQSIDAKPNFTIDLSRSAEGRPSAGVEKFYLHNSSEDESCMNEMVGSELFNAAGIPAPRVSHVIVMLNGRRLGLYVIKEGFSESFLRRSFAPPTGTLYEPAPQADVDGILIAKNGRDSLPGAALAQKLAHAALEPDLNVRLEQIPRLIDWDAFITFMALEVITSHWDGYSPGKNNFRVYYDDSRERLIFLPSGLDQLFGTDRFPVKPVMAGLVARSVMELPEGADLLQKRMCQVVNCVFDPERINTSIQNRVNALRPHLTRAEFAALKENADQRGKIITARAAFLRRELGRPTFETSFTP